MPALPPPPMVTTCTGLRLTGRDVELLEQGQDAAFEVVADRADGGGIETIRVVEIPVSYRVPGKIGQASPQPMVITRSAARTISSVHGFGYSPVMSIPRSAMAAIAAGLISWPGSEPPD